MGMEPRVVDRLSLWEFLACLDGWAAAHGGKTARGGDIAEADLRAMGVAGF